MPIPSAFATSTIFTISTRGLEHGADIVRDRGCLWYGDVDARGVVERESDEVSGGGRRRMGGEERLTMGRMMTKSVRDGGWNDESFPTVDSEMHANVDMYQVHKSAGRERESQV